MISTGPGSRIIRMRITFARGLLYPLLATLTMLVVAAIVTQTQELRAWLIPIVGTVLASGLIYLLRTRYYTAGLSLTAVLVTGLPFLVLNDTPVSVLAMLTTSIIITSIISGRTFFLICNLLIGLRIVLYLVDFVPQMGDLSLVMADSARMRSEVIGTTLIVFFPFVVGALLRYFNLTQERLSLEARRSADLLEASATIGQVMARLLDLEELMNRAVEIIRDRFGFYHVQIFLIDEAREYAVLRASTGEVGQQLLARQHRLALDSRSVVGRVARSGEAVVARDTDRDERHAFNELLPETRAELALALVDGETVIGVLDAQSTRSNAFTPIEIQALQVMASQLATAIRNARLFATQERNVNENKRLFLDTETSLREIQRLNRQLSRQAWVDYLGRSATPDRVTVDADQLDFSGEWTPAMEEAVRRRRPISSPDRARTAVPIELRGEVIGAIEVETEAAHAESIELLQAVAQRLAVSLDNARLIEEVQAASVQEQRVSEVVARFPATSSIDELLQVSLAGLAETFGAETATIRLLNPNEAAEKPGAARAAVNGGDEHHA